MPFAPSVILTVTCAAGAGSWYDYRFIGGAGSGADRGPGGDFRRSAWAVLAAMGAAGALALTATTSGLPAYIGVIMLAGIVVGHAILPVPLPLGIGGGAGRVAIDRLAASTLVTPALVPSASPLFAQGFTRSRRGAAHRTPERAQG
jgi:hypothetical protein